MIEEEGEVVVLGVYSGLPLEDHPKSNRVTVALCELHFSQGIVEVAVNVKVDTVSVT